MSNVITQLESDTAVTVSEFKKVRDQLVMEGDLLCRNVKLPLEGTVFVPVIPKTLREDVLLAANVNSRHAPWETMCRMLRCRCYFPHLASACQQYVSQCARCAAANPQQGSLAPSTRADILELQRTFYETFERILSLTNIEYSIRDSTSFTLPLTSNLSARRSKAIFV